MRPLLCLLACCAIALADEPQPDPATRHLPADAIFVVRVAAPDRFDAIGRDLPVLGDLFAMRGTLGDEFRDAAAGGAPMDPSKPMYWAVRPEGVVTLFRAAPGTTAEQVAALAKTRVPAQVRLSDDGWIRIADEGTPTEGAEPLQLLPGDVSIAVPVARLVVKHKGKIDEAFANLDKLDGIAEKQGVPVPPAVAKFRRLLAAMMLRVLADVEDVHYALTWRDGRLESEGWLRTREGSALRRWLEARKGTKPNDLMGLLPDRAFWMVESSGTSAALDADVAALLDEVFGEGGSSLLLLLSPAYALHDQLTGQGAGAIMVHGLMALSMRAVHEVKPDAPIGEAIQALDVTKINGILGGLAEAKLERDIAKSGDTPIHRLTVTSPVPQAAMFLSQMTTCFAVEGRYLLVAQSATAENEVRALILKVRSGERTAHPHTKAMERLMPDRQEGISMNLGCLKPLVGLAAMAAPEAAEALKAIPDDLWLSTALAVRGGNIHIRGDWPVKECLEFAAKVKAMGR